MKLFNSFDSAIRSIAAGFVLLLLNAKAFAQDKKLDVDIDINKQDEWYRQPWVWVVGGAVFILILVALLRGGKKE